MTEYTRYRFKSTSIVCAAPVVMSYPQPRRPGEAPVMEFGGQKHYMISSSSFRGKIRRYVFKNIFNKLRAVNPEISFSSADARLMVLGGVKGSGKTDHLSPQKALEVRRRRPDLEIFGGNDPSFISGCLQSGMTMSVQPAPERVDPDTTIPIVRRTLLTDSILSEVKISDAGSMDELQELNQQRAKLTDAINKLKRLERKARTPREQRDFEGHWALVSGMMGRPVTDIGEAEQFLSNMRESMKAEGHSDVSERNVQFAPTIPGGSELQQVMYLNYISELGAGLFLWGWHDAYVFDPTIGGLASRGAGGYLTSVYAVERQEGYNWVPDCTLRVEPDVGLSFHAGVQPLEQSKLKQSFDAWRDVDISGYDFTFNGLKAFIAEKG
jgi:hypothetical protein